jgi:lysophospholipase L1-like esterase
MLLQARSTVLAAAVFLGLGSVATACGNATGPGDTRSDVDPGLAPDGGTEATSTGDGGGCATCPPEDGAGPDAAEPIDPGPPAVQLIGRFDARDPAGPKCSWPGCRVIARFDGTSVSVRMTENVAAWMAGGPSEWDVAIDGEWKDKLVLSQGTHDYVLATGLPPGPHKVELYKRSETQNGTSQFLGYDFGGGTLLPPPLRRTRRIEIIGDSQPAAFGVEGVGYPDLTCPGLNYAAAWQNFRKSFGALLGETLSAEVHGTVYSGKGVVKNIWRADQDTMPMIYARSNPIDATSAFDLSSWTPDVIVVMLGGNDFSIGQPDESAPGSGPPTPAEFTSAYDAFVGTLRGHYPSAFILLTVSPSVTDDQPPGRASRTNILSTIKTVADGNGASVAWFAPALATAAELQGCEGHGTPQFHVRVAGELSAQIRAKTGW